MLRYLSVLQDYDVRLLAFLPIILHFRTICSTQDTTKPVGYPIGLRTVQLLDVNHDNYCSR